MDGRGSRNKGARGEREIVAILREAGLEAEKLSRSGYSTADVYVEGMLGEVKRQESMSKVDWKWLDQTEEAEILFKRVNGKPWLVVMELSTFINLVE